jgi:hypothetical protein
MFPKNLTFHNLAFSLAELIIFACDEDQMNNLLQLNETHIQRFE